MRCFNLKVFFPLVVFLFLAGMLWRGLDLPERNVLPSMLIGKPLPYFALRDLMHTQQWVTQRDLKGRVSLLHVWGSFCESCREEHAFLMQLSTHLPIYGIDYRDDPAQARQWLKQAGNPYVKVGIDDEGRVAVDLGVYGMPETYLVDAHGIVRYKHRGPLSPELWEAEFVPRMRIQE